MLFRSYKCQMPFGLEYLDRDAVRKPLTLKFRRATLREIIAAMEDEAYAVSDTNAPQYRYQSTCGVEM